MKHVKTLLFTTAIVFSTANADSYQIDDWKLNRLLSPTFPEIQDEVLWRTITVSAKEPAYKVTFQGSSASISSIV